VHPSLGLARSRLVLAGRRLVARCVRPARWAAASLAVIALFGVLLALAGGLALSRADGGPVAAWAKSTGHDAVWLGRAWARGEYTTAGLHALERRIAGSGIEDIYTFVGQIDADGHLSAAGYAAAGPFLAAMRGALPRVRVSAWLGGVLAGGPGSDRPAAAPGPMDLGNPAVRSRIVRSAAAVLRTGFSGVHYDLEPVANGDRSFLRLLAATSKLRPRPDPLSVSVPKLEPLPGLRLPWQITGVGPVFWTPGYLRQVSGLVDQVALMTYDTAMPFPSWYGGYLVRETELALGAVPARVGLLIGVPCYHYTTIAHIASAETAAAAIHGIRVALTAAGGGRQNVGVALFADYSATPADWRAYVTDWFRPG
jgi:hypothetical protein